MKATELRIGDNTSINTLLPLRQHFFSLDTPKAFGKKRIQEISKIRQNEEKRKMSNLSGYFALTNKELTIKL